MATAAIISFGKIRGVFYPQIDTVRVRDTLATLPGSSTDAALDGETAFVANAGTSMIACAVGTTPDATATASTAATSAGFGLAPGTVVFIYCRAGDKINVAALT